MRLITVRSAVEARVGPLFCSVLRDSHSSKVCRQAWQAHMKARATSCLLNYGHRDKCTDDEMMTYKWSLLAIYISLCSRQIFRRCSPLGRSGGIGCPGEILPPGLKPSDERDASPGAPSRSKIAQARQNVQEHHQKEWMRRTQICKETAPYLQQVSYRSWLERTGNNCKVRGSSLRGTTIL